MIRQRNGYVSKRLIRKLLALVLLLFGLRLVWISVFSGWSTSATKRNENPSPEVKNVLQFSDKDKHGGDRHFKFSEVKLPNEVMLEGENDVPAENLEEKSADNANKDQIILTTSSDPQHRSNKEITTKSSLLTDKITTTRGAQSENKNAIPDVARKSAGLISPSPNVSRISNNDNSISKDNSKKEHVDRGDTIKDKERKSNAERSSVNILKTKEQSQVTEEIDQGFCKVLQPWEDFNKDSVVSTYDLFQNVSYEMTSEGQYPIPVRKFDDIAKTEPLPPVQVILVPFSHADPGYGLTLEQYYAQMTQGTLENMVVKLNQYPNMTFQWAETVFLARWFQDINEEKKVAVKKLVARGQLEIVLGGWVMPDEASTNYVAVVDQLIEGHQWLVENLGVRPKSAWVNDPFGYSSTMPYFWKSTGMDNLLFLRINQPVKAKLMKDKSLDFLWRPYWESTNRSDVLSTLMSYTNYWASDVCGPIQAVCDEFNYLHLGESNSRSVAVTDDNVAVQAEKLYQQFRITADLYKYKTLYIGLGEDFSFPRDYNWDFMYTNYEKLINYINNNKQWNMNIKFGTLSEYFDNVRKQENEMTKQEENNNRSQLSFPKLSGDFFPYTERNQEFWTGYFTTRPLNKRFSREIETLIRASDIFNVMVYSIFKYYGVEFKAEKAVAENLRIARRELGMFMHHDGITGTSLPHVVEDFEKRLFKAYEVAQTALKTTLLTILSKGKQNNSKLLREVQIKSEPKKMTGSLVIKSDDAQVIFVNPLSKRRKEIVNLFVRSNYIEISSPTKNNVPYQITAGEMNGEVLPSIVSFEIELPAFGIEVYSLKQTSNPKVRHEVYEQVPDGEDKVITIENTHMKVEFNGKTGMIERVIDNNGRVTNISTNFMVYQAKGSGAYIFGPSGPASLFKTGERVVKVTRGPFASDVKVTFPGFFFSVKLYNCTSIQGQGLHVRTEVDIASVRWQEMEVILRFDTDIQNGQNFYTDQNGFQLIGRQNKPEHKIEANYYPITTMAVLEDQSKRFSLHCKQPHGSASLGQGQLEVMLDRTTFRDDQRGLGQGVYDNVKVNSEFIIQIEYKTTQFKPKEVRYSYPSQDSVLINDMLQNGVLKYVSEDSSLALLKKIHPLKSVELPCDVSVVGLRNLVKNNLEYNGTSLVLHRRPFHCGFESLNNQCHRRKGENRLTVKGIFPKLKAKITETSLSHLYTIQELTSDSDITPNHSELRAFHIRF